MRDEQARSAARASSAGAIQPIGLGIVGCGDLAQNVVLPHLAQPDALLQARVAALCGRTLERTRGVAQRYHIPHVTDNYEALLADPDVQAVLILTPARLHFAQTLAAVRAGKHVYVQKPLTESLQEALTLEREVQRHGVRLVAAPGQALNPLLSTLRGLLEEGAIGTAFWANAPAASWGGKEIRFPSNPAWYFREGSGPFRDMAVYALHVLIALFGLVRRVCAMQALSVKRRSWEGRPFMVTVPDNVVAHLDFGNGLLATVGAQWCHGGPLAQPFQFGIYGLEGSIETREYHGAWATACELRREDGTTHRLALEPGEAPAPPHADLSPHIWADIAHLLDCIREDREPIAGVATARHVVEIFDATTLAAETGQTRTLGTGL